MKKSTPQGEEIFTYEARFYTYGRKTGFYRPHDPELGSFNNTDPVTGEVYPSMTKQSEMDACDINNILKQYSPAGLQQLIAENTVRGQYVDLPDEIDFQAALNTVLEGQAAFATLPAKTRERFHNSPAEFLEFMADPNNQDEAVKLGLMVDTRPKPQDPLPVEIVANRATTGGDGGSPPSKEPKAP